MPSKTSKRAVRKPRRGDAEGVWQNLPAELWQRMVHWLYIDDLFRLAQVSKAFNATFGDHGLVLPDHPADLPRVRKRTW